MIFNLGSGGGAGDLRYNENTDMVEIYYNGQWNEWKMGNMQVYYLFNAGDECRDETGGWSKSGDSGAVAFVNDGSSFVAVAGTSSSSKNIMTNQTIDLTNYNKLVIEMSVSAVYGTPMRMIVSSDSQRRVGASAYRELYVEVSTSGVTELDISGISGKHYISMYNTNSYTTGNITKVYMK